MDVGKLLDWRDAAGTFYGSEDQAIFLYSLVKMLRPRTVVELGTGLGVSSFWIGQALQENGAGHLQSIDDGSHWQKGAVDSLTTSYATLLRRIREYPCFASIFPSGRIPDHQEWLRALARVFELQDTITFTRESLDMTSLVPQKDLPLLARLGGAPIDMLFSDFSHGPYTVLALLAQFLPLMAAAASIFIDSASTSWLSYFTLEQTVAQMNSGKVPAGLVAGADAQQRERIRDLVATRKFTLVHIVERKEREQNGLAWIRIEPVNVVPYPLTAMRNGAGQVMLGSAIEALFQPDTPR